MTHPDLLTDEDIATRHEPPKGYFNQYVATTDNFILCAHCERVLAQNQGEILFSCCPATFSTYEAAVADAHEECADTGNHLCDYIGTFEL